LAMILREIFIHIFALYLVPAQPKNGYHIPSWTISACVLRNSPSVV
jgi:hypothetical protein